MPYKDKEQGLKRRRELYVANSEKKQQFYQEHVEEFTTRNRKRYARNPDYFIVRNAQRRQELRELIQQQKIGRVCALCGIDDWRVLDFHHREQSMKEGGIGDAVSHNWSKERILGEIAKCDTLCANCHRILHWEQRYST
jgi:predicted HNH restriction endonuclease